MDSPSEPENPTPSSQPAPGQFRSLSSAHWLPPTADQLQPLLPDYEISTVLGIGGMGAVYRGKQTTMGREVAIKILPVSNLGEDAEGMNFAKRFKQEARTMANLNHPSIIKVFGFGEAGSAEKGNEILWFAMEFVEGCDINEYLKENGGSISPEHAIAITCHVLDGLATAHAEGIAHRDIKPANIMLDTEGRVKIADFGLAKDFGGEDPGLTMTNMAMGTPGYVSPEALDSTAVLDHRSDLYSLGAMFYQMLTAKVPQGQFKMPSELIPGLDRRLDGVASKALQTDPNDRFQSAQEFRAALDAILLFPEADFSPQSGAIKIAESQKLETSAGQPATSAPEPPASEAPPKEKSQEGAKKKGEAGQPAVIGSLVGMAVLALAGAGWMIASSKQRAEPVAGAEEPAPLVASTSGPAPPATAIDTREPEKPEEKSEPPEPAAPPRKVERSTETIETAEAEVERPRNNDTAPPKIADAIDPGGHTAAAAADPEPKAEPKPGPKKEPKPEPAAPAVAKEAEADDQEDPLPELTKRIKRYQEVVEQRATAPMKKNIGTLAANYQRAIDQQIDKLAAQGKLETINALRGEKKMVQSLVESLPEKKVEELSLAQLSKDAPKELTTLRNTWSGAVANYRKTHDSEVSKLSQQFSKSLQGLELSLTKSKQFDQATMVKAYREGLLAGTADTTGHDAGSTRETNRSNRVGNSAMSLAAATKDKPYVNTLEMRFVPVPIKSGPSKGKRVLFSVWETRVSDYEAFVKAERRDWPKPDFPQEDDHPAVRVSWEDAVAFCEWLTERERKKGKLGPNESYRLPTDHEWSCAVGIGRDEDASQLPTQKNNRLGEVYPWGKQWPPPAGSGNYRGEETRKNPLLDGKEPIKGYTDGFDRTAPVGSYELEHNGIKDLSGNVREWCQDWFSGDQSRRVLRGGSWINLSEVFLRSSYRDDYSPTYRNLSIGFRCVVEAG